MAAMLRSVRHTRTVLTGGPDVIRKEAWPFYRTIPGVRLCWELEEPKGPDGSPKKDVVIAAPKREASRLAFADFSLS